VTRTWLSRRSWGQFLALKRLVDRQRRLDPLRCGDDDELASRDASPATKTPGTLVSLEVPVSTVPFLLNAQPSVCAMSQRGCWAVVKKMASSPRGSLREAKRTEVS